ncbi:hypothetical protein LEN26_006419 [Aphanomyces euteiches]|nr:hypothetical protein LEN26_006419 [Aphanomyces euteiches]
MNDKTRMTSDAHLEFMVFVLELYGKSWSNVVALIGDNCSTNIALARKAAVSFIGCASHRFNLAVKDILANHEPLLAKINRIMLKLQDLVPAAQLRQFTSLQSRPRNATLWISTFMMIQRCMQIKDFLPLLGNSDIMEMLPGPHQQPRDDAAVEELLVLLKDLESISKKLQDETSNLSTVRYCFDAVIEEHPETSSRLAPLATIVACPEFENVIVKILIGQDKKMNDGEKKSVCRLRRDANQDVDGTAAEGTCLSLAERACIMMTKSEDNYVDVRFLRPTSNMCERFFSIAKHALPQRHSVAKFRSSNVSPCQQRSLGRSRCLRYASWKRRTL